jgi:hypothetical protein
MVVLIKKEIGGDFSRTIPPFLRSVPSRRFGFVSSEVTHMMQKLILLSTWSIVESIASCFLFRLALRLIQQGVCICCLMPIEHFQ